MLVGLFFFSCVAFNHSKKQLLVPLVNQKKHITVLRFHGCMLRFRVCVTQKGGRFPPRSFQVSVERLITGEFARYRCKKSGLLRQIRTHQETLSLPLAASAHHPVLLFRLFHCTFPSNPVISTLPPCLLSFPSPHPPRVPTRLAPFSTSLVSSSSSSSSSFLRLFLWLDCSAISQTQEHSYSYLLSALCWNFYHLRWNRRIRATTDTTRF